MYVTVSIPRPRFRCKDFFIDTIIIACAKSSDCTLVHMDRHFDLAGKVIKIKLKSFL